MKDTSLDLQAGKNISSACTPTQCCFLGFAVRQTFFSQHDSICNIEMEGGGGGGGSCKTELWCLSRLNLLSVSAVLSEIVAIYLNFVIVSNRKCCRSWFLHVLLTYIRDRVAYFVLT